MKRVLFVDDEPGVLDGLRDLMRRHRKKWDMAFALGGEAALEQFRAAPFDVVIADMRMPGKDGATLLAEIREQSPQTVRIILSGYSEPESVLRAVTVAHQFLAKPCDAATLEGAVDRACNLQALISDEKLRRIVGRIGNLPSHPEVYRQLLRKLEEPEATTGEIADVLEMDTAMCAKLLQVVNSAFFGLPRTITRVGDAVSYLGSATIRDLTLATSVFCAAGPPKGFSMEALQRHSLLTAGIARRMLGGKQGEEAFMAGILHDIGLLILATELPDDFDRVLQAVRGRGGSLHESEREILGVTHEGLGAYLLSLWSLPPSVVEAVGFHHRPQVIDHPTFDLPAVTYVADHLAQEADGALCAALGVPNDIIDEAYLERLGVHGSLPEWREMAKELAAAPGTGG